MTYTPYISKLPQPSRAPALGLVLASFLSLSCQRSGKTPINSPKPPPQRNAASPKKTLASKAPPSTPADSVGAPSPSNKSPHPFLLIDDPTQLSALVKQGNSLAQLAFESPANTDLESLAKHKPYANWVRAITSKISQSQRGDPRSGVGMRFGHRQFDTGWLSSKDANFELVGVVNRYDRAPFFPEYCGELRLIYRLFYKTKRSGVEIASRLPMTVNLVLWQPKPAQGTCSSLWAQWQNTKDAFAGLEPLLDPGTREIKSLEVNLQSVRWPSMMHPSLGGHAEYLMMVFKPSPGTGFEPARLENQPKSQRWSQGSMRAFRAWLSAPKQLHALANGTIRIPDEYLATHAISIAPHGLARGANRPFLPLMPKALYSDFPYHEVPGLSNYAELTRRLDTMSCVGCHQSRSLAGFHFLGQDPSEQKVDALAVPLSPHLLDELAIRSQHLAAAAASGHANRPRPIPQRSLAHAPGGWGDHCGRTGVFTNWQCARGLTCVASSDPELGVCHAAGPRTTGEPCELTSIVPKRDSRLERGRITRPQACAAGVCERTKVGFPSGMCSRSCSDLGPQEVCGGIAVLTDFNQCLADQRSFARCISDHTRPAALRRCDLAHPCRDDMICSRVDQLDKGACIPPYFLFQLRVDGHPKSQART